MEIVTQFFDWVLQLLPTSPFIKYINLLERVPFLNHLNWFIPISTFITIGQAWLVAIGIFYLYMVILRWIKAIE